MDPFREFKLTSPNLWFQNQFLLNRCPHPPFRVLQYGTLAEVTLLEYALTQQEVQEDKKLARPSERSPTPDRRALVQVHSPRPSVAATLVYTFQSALRPDRELSTIYR